MFMFVSTYPSNMDGVDPTATSLGDLDADALTRIFDHRGPIFFLHTHQICSALTQRRHR